MLALTREKLDQARRLVAASGLDIWMTFVRETSGGGDPALPLILTGALTWQSALMVSKDGKAVAVVGNYDAEPLEATGDWDEVIPYVRSIREPLNEALNRLVPEGGGPPRIGVNHSLDDGKADGITWGMYLVLCDYLKGTRFENAIESAESVIVPLRSVKTPGELERIRDAVRQTDRLLAQFARSARIGVSEQSLFDSVQDAIDDAGLGYAWDRSGNPIVNTGPNSMVGHGRPSHQIKIAPGHILHIDVGVQVDGYCSDVQRCWYVQEAGEAALPEDVVTAWAAVMGAIDAGRKALAPGALGWQVDKAARSALVASGYPQYMHALGHQVGRAAHDGGGVLGPTWERYGRTTSMSVEEGEVYTLELGVMVEGRGYLGVEEMVVVTGDGCDYLTERQTELPLLAADRTA
ncbi:MAG: aminopeptidase P family protein [Armatimonadetes bacterium]|nr:aminopeptidase P family protein [Armatimonadota bacterium]MDE2205501.1 aminopeptidase P family protein [Armatimonadota bacterium]